MAEIELLQYVEIDLKPCSLTYGVYPCGASLGVTGTKKCYNSPATCQSVSDFNEGSTVTHRFAVGGENLPTDLVSIPNIKTISLRPQEIKPGESLGTRESGTVTFFNHRHNDVGFDNYLDDRSFNPYNRGTFWGKFKSRWPNLQGSALRTLIGSIDDDYEDLETRHYFIESTEGPNGDGTFKIIFKDALKFLDGQKAQAPIPSLGSLSAAINDTDTALTLQPTGIGNSFYPSSGTASIGGEMVTFTRSGDNVTLTGRGLYSSDQEDHDEDETFQMSLIYSAADIANIIDDLIYGTNEDGTSRTNMPATYQNVTAWLEETTAFFGRLYTGIIARPTPIATLVSEIIEHAGLLFYCDTIAQKLKLQILRQGVIAVAVTDSIVAPDSFRVAQNEGRRIDSVWTSFGQKNPLINLNEDGNFKAIEATYDDDETKVLENLPPAIKRVYSRWIIVSNRVAAQEFNDLQLVRWADTPDDVQFKLPYGYPVKLGTNITYQSRISEDDEGAAKDPEPGIITSVKRTSAWYECKAASIKFRNIDTTDRTILIDDDALNLNLRTLHDLIYTTPTNGDTVTVIIQAGVTIGAALKTTSTQAKLETADPAFDVGDWPAGVTINITNYGTIQGGAGIGAAVKLEWIAASFYWRLRYQRRGSDGGIALYTRYAINMDNQGSIWGGGGGAGADDPPTSPAGAFFESFGGFGSGYLLHTDYFIEYPYTGEFAPSSVLATASAGGKGGYNSYNTPGGSYSGTLLFNTDSGLDGGDPGNAGVSGTDASVSIGENLTPWPTAYNWKTAGSAGSAVDGDSYVTYSIAGDIQGSQIN